MIPIVIPPVAIAGAKVIASWVAVNTGFAIAGATKAAIEERRREIQTNPTKLSFKERLTGKVNQETAEDLASNVVTEEQLVAKQTAVAKKGAN